MQIITQLCLFTTFVLVAYGCYKIICIFVNLPTSQTNKNISLMNENKGGLIDMIMFAVTLLTKLIALIIDKMRVIDMHKRIKLVRNLNRAGYSKTPETFYAEQVSIGLVGVVSGIVVYILVHQ